MGTEQIPHFSRPSPTEWEFSRWNPRHWGTRPDRCWWDVCSSRTSLSLPVLTEDTGERLVRLVAALVSRGASAGWNLMKGNREKLQVLAVLEDNPRQQHRLQATGRSCAWEVAG